MRKLPTDLELLNAIYERYYDTFTNYSEEKPTRDSKNYVPIDLNALARDLGVDSDIVFGRLYYDLESRYGYDVENDKSHTYFFSTQVGGDRHCVHFPYLAAVLAGLRDQRRQYHVSTVISILGFVVSIVAVVVAALHK